MSSALVLSVNSNGETIVFWSSFSDYVVAAKAKTGCVGVWQHCCSPSLTLLAHSEIVWYTSEIGELLRSTPAVYECNSTHGGIAVVGGDAQLWMFDADTGKKIWAVPSTIAC